MAQRSVHRKSSRRLPTMRGAGRRIGLLGGSFNPAHEGHRHVSLAALRRLGLDEVWWVVAPRNPLKPKAGMAPFAERLAAARALAGDPRIRVTDIEARLGTRYTIDTVRALRRAYPGTRFVLLVGADILEQLPRWRRWDSLFRSVAIAVFARTPYSFKALAGIAAHRFARARIAEGAAGTLAGRTPPAWAFLHGRAHPASATAIRKRPRGAREARAEKIKR